MCGNWNGNPGDDLEGGSPNSMGNIYQVWIIESLQLRFTATFYPDSVIVLNIMTKFK